MDKKFDPEELAQFNGDGEQPSYVAVGGKVYDVTASKLWRNGQHMKRHKAGGDLTGELNAAPHGQEVFTRESVKYIGEMGEAKVDQDLHPVITKLFGQFPFLRRHPHPMMVHFPIAFLFAGGLFVILQFLGLWKSIPFETMANVMIILATLSTVPAIASGFIAWRINYNAKMMPQIKRKLVWSGILSILLFFAIILRTGGAADSGIIGVIYHLVVVFLPINVGIIGYYGAQLTFPE